ncbi:uncharacterized protein LOC131927624 [Physella acuta]|uniref:uncharacterized protein LOC131927624 n=1 Tax=Physella acuta TaxID=109671 RepID=UPI0027DD47B6|nr:uncharacterized protein LOC131927624 [Physella acuta]
MHLNLFCTTAAFFLISSVAVSSAEVTFYPPDLPPVVTVNNKTVRNGQILRLDKSKTMVNGECTVEGGNPKVLSITLQCAFDGVAGKVTINSYIAEFEITYNSTIHTIACVCSAYHVTGLYTLTTSFVFNSGSNAVIWNVLLLTSLVLGRTVLS